MKINAKDEGFKVNLNIPKILRELKNLTNVHRPVLGGPARLFGNDLLSSVDILRRTTGFLKTGADPKKSAKESFLPFTETASNLLDLGNRATWEEIDEVRSETCLHSKVKC